MSRAFRRTARLTFFPEGEAARVLEGLRMAFTFDRTDEGEPNPASVTVYNLGDDWLGIVRDRATRVWIEAGYAVPELVGTFDIADVRDRFDGQDRVTVFEGGDGAQALSQAHLYESFSSGTPVQQVFQRLAGALGLPLGEVPDFSGQFSGGFAANGSVRRSLDRLCIRVNARWSVQDGALQVLPIGKPSREPSVRLDVDSGLIGTPETTEQGATVTCLLNPALKPGRQVRIDAAAVTGSFTIRRVRHEADTRSDAWTSELEVQR